MQENPSSAPSAHPSSVPDPTSKAPIAAEQAGTKKKVDQALAGAASPTDAAAPSDHTSHLPAAVHPHDLVRHETHREKPIIPTPEWLQNSDGPELPSRGKLARAVLTVGGIFSPPLAILGGAAYASASVARKYFPPYRWLENGVKKVASVSAELAKDVGSSAHGLVGRPLNKFVLNPIKTVVLRPSINIANWVLDIPRDILHFVEAKLGIIEPREGRNKIDGAAVALLGAWHAGKSVVKELWAHKKTTAVAIALLYGASLLPGGIPGFLTSISTSLATIFQGGLSSLGTALTTAPGAATTVAAPAAGGGGSFFGDALKWALGF